MVNYNLRHIQWLEGKASPEILTERDLDELLNSKALFARKFDVLISSGVLDQLDKKILNHT
jgi:hypothetical protein